MTVNTKITKRIRTLILPNGQEVELKHGQKLRDILKR